MLLKDFKGLTTIIIVRSLYTLFTIIFFETSIYYYITSELFSIEL